MAHSPTDAWSPGILVIPTALTGLFVLLVGLDDEIVTLIPMMLTLLIAALFGLGWLVVVGLRREPRRAASIALGLAIMCGCPALTQRLSPAIRNLSWQTEIPHFAELVAKQRRLAPGQPVQMVVAYRDQSAFAAGTPLFETILYDETDGLATGTNGLTGYWPYPKASTGKLAVWGEQHQVWSLGQHYYRVVTTL